MAARVSWYVASSTYKLTVGGLAKCSCSPGKYAGWLTLSGFWLEMGSHEVGSCKTRLKLQIHSKSSRENLLPTKLCWHQVAVRSNISFTSVPGASDTLAFFDTLCYRMQRKTCTYDHIRYVYTCSISAHTHDRRNATSNVKYVNNTFIIFASYTVHVAHCCTILQNVASFCWHHADQYVLNKTTALLTHHVGRYIPETHVAGDIWSEKVFHDEVTTLCTSSSQTMLRSYHIHTIQLLCVLWSGNMPPQTLQGFPSLLPPFVSVAVFSLSPSWESKSVNFKPSSVRGHRLR